VQECPEVLDLPTVVIPATYRVRDVNDRRHQRPELADVDKHITYATIAVIEHMPIVMSSVLFDWG
jgi:hypothetical protein